jgi:capsular polysaccharide biosynthesis protein
MEEIDLKEMLSYFWNKKILIIILMVVGLVGGILYSTNFQKPLYKSYTTILLTKEADKTTIDSTTLALNKNLVDTYREIIKSRNVLGKVKINLDLDYTVDELMKNVTVESVNDTEIIKIIVIDPDKKTSMKIANEIADVFKTEVVKLYSIQNIGIIDEAELAEKPYNISLLKTGAITTGAGLLLGLGIVFVIFYFDTSIKSAEEVERKLGLPVIGTIPMKGGKRK